MKGHLKLTFLNQINNVFNKVSYAVRSINGTKRCIDVHEAR